MTQPADPTGSDGGTGVGPVSCTVSDGVATIRLDRPRQFNALDRETRELLLGLLGDVATDSAVRCLVVTGSGPAFCVGQDLREHLTDLRDGTLDLAESLRRQYNPIVQLVATMPKPVVAALNGVTAGAGASIALAADIRVMADTAGINTAFAAIALSCDTGMSWTLPRLVGHARALDLLMLPRTIPAAECLELGLVSRVVPAAEVQTTVAQLAARLASGPTLAYAAIRSVVGYASTHDLADSLDHEIGHMQTTVASADHLRGVEAFLAKTPATFLGR